MKVRALASISGPMGRKVAGDDFVVSAVEAQSLIDRNLVEASPMDPAPAPSNEKPSRAKQIPEE